MRNLRTFIWEKLAKVAKTLLNSKATPIPYVSWLEQYDDRKIIKLGDQRTKKSLIIWNSIDVYDYLFVAIAIIAICFHLKLDDLFSNTNLPEISLFKPLDIFTAF